MEEETIKYTEKDDVKLNIVDEVQKIVDDRVNSIDKKKELARQDVINMFLSSLNIIIMKVMVELGAIDKEERELRFKKLSQMYEVREQRLMFTAIAEAELRRVTHPDLAERYGTNWYRYLMEWWVCIGKLEQVELIDNNNSPVLDTRSKTKPYRDKLSIFVDESNVTRISLKKQQRGDDSQ